MTTESGNWIGNDGNCVSVNQVGDGYNGWCFLCIQHCWRFFLKFPCESERFPFPCKDSGPTERGSWNGKHSFPSVLAWLKCIWLTVLRQFFDLLQLNSYDADSLLVNLSWFNWFGILTLLALCQDPGNSISVCRSCSNSGGNKAEFQELHEAYVTRCFPGTKGWTFGECFGKCSIFAPWSYMFLFFFLDVV